VAGLRNGVGARTLDDEGKGDIGRTKFGGVRYLVSFTAKGR
jgi:hypothetical protein